MLEPIIDLGRSVAAWGMQTAAPLTASPNYFEAIAGYAVVVLVNAAGLLISASFLWVPFAVLVAVLERRQRYANRSANR
jgi:hypothetical protein